MTDDEMKAQFKRDQRGRELRAEPVEKVDRRFDAVDQRFDAVDQHFEETLRAIREESAATRLHMDIVAEGLRSEIRVIADGHGVLAERMTAMESRQDRADARAERIEDRQLAHEHRLRKLETGQ